MYYNISHGQMRPPGPLVALRLIFAAPVPLRDQLVFALHCTSMRTYAGYSTGCGEGTSSSFPSTPSKSKGHYVGTETKRREKCFTGALGRSRKSGDCKRMWHKEWELEYLEVTTAKMQYSAYRNDCSLDYQFLNSNKRPDMFFHQLSKVPEYSQFGLLSLILL